MNAAFSELPQKEAPSIYSSDLPPLHFAIQDCSPVGNVIYSESIDWEIIGCRKMVRACVGIIRAAPMNVGHIFQHP